jgi:hypothetical protein
LLLGLGWPEWVTIVGLLAGLWLTFRLMARASLAYERARRARESQPDGSTIDSQTQSQGKEEK